jgi:hypothetical protein
VTRLERGGYPAGGRKVSELPPPPDAVVAHDGWADVPLPGLADAPAQDAGQPADAGPDQWLLLGEVKRLHLGPGDRLAVTYPGPLRRADIEYIRAKVREFMGPDVPVMIFDQGADLTVVEGP